MISFRSLATLPPPLPLAQDCQLPTGRQLSTVGRPLTDVGPPRPPGQPARFCMGGTPKAAVADMIHEAAFPNGVIVSHPSNWQELTS